MKSSISQLGKRIRKARKIFNVSQDVFSHSLGVTQGHLSKIEKGKVIPSKRLIRSINEEWGIEIEWLKTGKGPIEKEPPRTDLADLEKIKGLIWKYESTQSEEKIHELDSFWLGVKYRAIIEEFNFFNELLNELIKKLKNSQDLVVDLDHPEAIKYLHAKKSLLKNLDQLQELLLSDKKIKKKLSSI